MFDPLIQQSATPVSLPSIYWVIGYSVGILAIPACISTAVVLLTHRRMDLGEAVVPHETREVIDFLLFSRRREVASDRRRRKEAA